MLSIGNDIIDLGNSDAKIDNVHPRFVERILSAMEIVRFRNRTSLIDPATMLWTYWAAKESAYKALGRVFPELKFIYKKFEFDYDANILSYTKHRLICKIKQEKNYIHVTAFFDSHNSHKTSLLKRVAHQEIFNKSKLLHPLATQSKMSDSLLLRTKFIQAFADKKNLHLEDLTIDTLSKSSGVPYVFYKGEPQSTAFTFSHHGDYLAYAFI